jgi:hypothetical protein
MHVGINRVPPSKAGPQIKYPDGKLVIKHLAKSSTHPTAKHKKGGRRKTNKTNKTKTRRKKNKGRGGTDLDLKLQEEMGSYIATLTPQEKNDLMPYINTFNPELSVTNIEKISLNQLMKDIETTGRMGELQGLASSSARGRPHWPALSDMIVVKITYEDGTHEYLQETLDPHMGSKKYRTVAVLPAETPLRDQAVYQERIFQLAEGKRSRSGGHHPFLVPLILLSGNQGLKKNEKLRRSRKKRVASMLRKAKAKTKARRQSLKGGCPSCGGA